MLQSFSGTFDRPLARLLRRINLPLSAWVALGENNVTTLERLKTVAPRFDKIPGIDPETAKALRAELKRLVTRRTLHVRLIFPKRLATTGQTSKGDEPTMQIRAH